MGDYRTLMGYQKAFDLAMRIHRITKLFPPEEKFGLTVQIRTSSRSVCVILWRLTKEAAIKIITLQN